MTHNKYSYLSKDPAVWQPHPDILKLSRLKDVALEYFPDMREIGIYVIKMWEKNRGPTAIRPMHYCPFTGRRLPGRLLGALWSAIRKSHGAEVANDVMYGKIKSPQEFRNDSWWRERRISLRTGRGYHIDPIRKAMAWVKETGHRLTWRDEEDDWDDHLPPGYRRGPYEPPHLCYCISSVLSAYGAMFWYVPWDREYGPRILDLKRKVEGQPIAVAPVPHCPWCGKKLPPSLKAQRLQRLEALGLSPDDPDLPEKWRTDQWWREEGLWPDKMPKDGAI